MEKLNRIYILVFCLLMLFIQVCCEKKTPIISEKVSKPVIEVPTVTDVPVPPRVYNNLMTEAEKSKLLLEASTHLVLDSNLSRPIKIHC